MRRTGLIGLDRIMAQLNVLLLRFQGFGFFIVNVDLTEEGIEHTDDIVGLVFQYLNMLRNLVSLNNLSIIEHV